MPPLVPDSTCRLRLLVLLVLSAGVVCLAATTASAGAPAHAAQRECDWTNSCPDSDGDGVADPDPNDESHRGDQCPTVPAATPTGCPFAARVVVPNSTRAVYRDGSTTAMVWCRVGDYPNSRLPSGSPAKQPCTNPVSAAVTYALPLATARRFKLPSTFLASASTPKAGGFNDLHQVAPAKLKISPAITRRIRAYYARVIARGDAHDIRIPLIVTAHLTYPVREVLRQTVVLGAPGINNYELRSAHDKAPLEGKQIHEHAG
jgi:hypothetical protein